MLYLKSRFQKSEQFRFLHFCAKAKLTLCLENVGRYNDNLPCFHLEFVKNTVVIF